MKKTILILIGSLFLCGCRQITEAFVKLPEEESVVIDEPVSVGPEESDNDYSLHPDDVTDYDRRAITALINAKLRQDFGKNNYYPVNADSLMFEKKDGIITASGEYTAKGEGGWQKVPFSWQYDDRNVEYVLLEDHSGDDVNLDEHTDESGEKGKEKNGALVEPDKTYTCRAGSGISITANHSGDGYLTIQIVDMDGNLVQTVFDDTGDFNETRRTDLETGSYQIYMKRTGGGSWGFSYSGY